MSEQVQLYELDWIAVPNEPYIMKYIFSDSEYNIIVSNLTFMYGESLADFKIQERFCKLNPYAEMKSQVILENLRKSLEKCLSEKSAPSMRFDEDKLLITLKFPVAHVLCSYEVEMDLMAADKVMQYITCPTVFGALLSQRKVLELKKRNVSEITRSSMPSNCCTSLQNIFEPEWIKGQNVSIETVLDSFLKLQSYFKELFAENYEAYSLLKKEKTKKTKSTQCITSQKRCKLEVKKEDDISDESPVKCDDSEQNISVKMENELSTQPSDASSVTSSQLTRDNVKKKKTFKI